MVKLLDPDIEEENIEIEKNKKLIKGNLRQGANFGNMNPKLNKKYKALKWFYYSSSEIDSTLYKEQCEIKQNIVLKTQASIKNNYPFLYHPYNQ